MKKTEILRRFVVDELDDVAQFTILNSNGLYWGRSEQLGAMLGLFFRPTGITYMGRELNIITLTRTPHNKVRFSLEMCEVGSGAGGVEVRAHTKGRESDQMPIDRLELLTDDWINRYRNRYRKGGWVCWVGAARVGPSDSTFTTHIPVLRPWLQRAKLWA